MKIKNAELEPLMDFLMSLELKGRESRFRTRFVKLLADRFKMIQQENFDLIKQYANLDEDGNPKIVTVNGREMYDVVDKKSYNIEYISLMNEDFIIEENEEKKEVLLLIKKLILDCEKTFKGGEALEYDRWCEIVEEVNYE